MAAFEYSVPILIAGAGACGAVAALAAREAGVEPLVIERDDRPGGSTAMSQGLICAAGSRFQTEHGIDDNPDIFFQDIMTKARGCADEEIARAISEGSAPALEWLCDTHGFPWELDTRFRASYGNSRMRVHGWIGHTGADMVQWLHRRLGDLNVDVLMSTRLRDVFVGTDGAITGVKLEGGDGQIVSVGCRALILACGGYGANRELTHRHMPETRDFRYHGHEGSEGDAILIGERLGAALGDLGSYQGYAMLSDPAGVSVPPGVLVEGGIILNLRGDRFTDETEDIAGMVLPLSREENGAGWVVFDETIEARCAHIPDMQQLARLGAIRRGGSSADLAEKIGVSVQAIEAALKDIDQARARGGRDSMGRAWNETHQVPRQHLCALRVVGAIYHTQGGLQIDRRARVVRKDGSYFENLFAGGGSARSVSGPSSWGYLPAMGLTTAVALGWIAGQEAAKFVQSRN